MSIETQAVEIIQQILEIDDAILEKEYNSFIKMFDIEENIQQAFIEKLAYCRANNLTDDDLIEENKIAEETIEEEFRAYSEIKQKLLKHIFGTATRINNLILEKGLYSKVKVKIEKLDEDIELPQYAHEKGDSGVDLKVINDVVIPPKSSIIAPTGLKVAIPLGYEIQIRPRSGNSLKDEYLYLTVANSPGTIDANYREEIGIILKNLGDKEIVILKGTKIAQAVLCPVVKIEWEQVDSINYFPTERKGGFGSTGA